MLYTIKMKMLSYNYGVTEIADGRVPGYSVNIVQRVISWVFGIIAFWIPGRE